MVSPSNDRVWVNGSDGSSVARFNKRFGIDIHNTATLQLSGAPECLWCTHGPAGAEAWELFRVELKRHYGIDLDPELIQF